jgi:cytoskeletal protein RodZ
MSTTTIVVIVVAAVGLLLLAAVLVWLAQRTRKHQRHNKAENIRGEAAEETLRVKQREALADETAAKARAAQAEADVKAAQATGLQQQAAAHRSEAATARDHLNGQWDRAEKLDPAAPTDETPSPTHKEPQSR